MKNPFFLFLLLIIPFFSNGDMGNAYIFKVELKHDKGVTTGYIWVSGYFEIDSLLEKQLYESDTMFTSFVKRNYYYDTMEVYKNIYTIDSLYINIFFKDKKQRIDTSKIIRMKLKSIQDWVVGSWVSPERFSLKDLSWLKKPYLYKETYETMNCTHYLYFFEKVKPFAEFENKKKKYPSDKIWEMSSEKQQEWENLIFDYFKKLDNHKVVIKSECGC